MKGSILLPYVNALKAIGAPPYVQIYNEPADDREWKPDSCHPTGLRYFGQQLGAAMPARVFDAGGYPGLQVLEQEELDAAIDAVRGMGRTDIWQRAFFCTHNYGANHPPAYPYDIGKTVFDDFYGVLSFLAFAKWMQERIGFVLPIIGGEGGWQWGSDQDKRYPKVEDPLHGAVPSGDVRVVPHRPAFQRRAAARLPFQRHALDRGRLGRG